MVCLLPLHVYMRKTYEEDKTKRSFYKLGKKGCCWAKNASSQIKQMIDFHIWYCKAYILNTYISESCSLQKGHVSEEVLELIP